MKLVIGSRVYTSDGQYAGFLARVVVDPASGKPTDIVVFRDGSPLDHEVVVPISAVRRAARSQVVLRIALLGASFFPEYVEGDYTSPTEAWGPTDGYSHAEVLFPVSHSTKAISPDRAVVVGMGVEANDGPVGVVEDVRADPVTAAPTSFILRGLHNGRERFVVPIDWVTDTRGRWVRVDCNSAQIHGMLETP